MPRFNQTGPEGKGPQTGGRRGPCATENSTRNHQRGFGRRMRKHNENQQDTGEGWSPDRGFGRGMACGGGQHRRFRGGQN
ncbi:MAG: DUF5320 domain-containing protein [Bacteroidales bacterium]|nr:DUF5320 domain-containing protein [Bacteroidales bacterium]